MSYGALGSGNINQTGIEITEVINNIKYGLEMVNDKDGSQWAYKEDDLRLMDSHILEVEGNNNHTLAYEDFEIFFQDTGMAVSSQEFEEDYETWNLKRKGYQVTNGSFTPDFFHKERDADRDPFVRMLTRTEAIQNKYQKTFKPNHLWEAIIKVPSVGGTYYEKKGALRDTVVKEGMLKRVVTGATAGEKGSTTRNHFRAIANSSGISSADLRSFRQYFNEYKGVNVNSLRMAGNLTTEDTMKEIFNDTATLDSIIFNGIEGKKMEGMVFNTVNMLPDNILMMYVDAPDKKFISKLVSKRGEYRGLYTRSSQNFKLHPETMEDLSSMDFHIGSIGYDLIGRHLVMFIDIDPERVDGTIDRLMNQDGIDAITEARDFLVSEWKKTVR